MTTDTYSDTPIYYWYTAKSYPNHFRTEWYNGIEYIALTKPAAYEDIERYDLREKGMGDMEWLKSAHKMS